MGVNAGIVEFANLNDASQEGPHLVRLKKAGLRRRINGQLTLRYEAGGLTSFAGSELVGRFIRRLRFGATLRCVERALPQSDFGAVRLSMLVLAMLIADTGGCGTCVTWRTIRWWSVCADFPGCRVGTPWGAGCADSMPAASKALLEVNERLVAEVIGHSGLPRLTLDVDSSVASTGLCVEGVRRGFNPHRRKVPSYYPITAYEANTGQVLRVRNRSGNVHDGKASLAFLGELFEQLGATLKRRPVLAMRMDGAFFHEAVIDVLEEEGALYAIKAPFWRWLGLKERIAGRRRWERVDETVESFDQWLWVPAWSRAMRVVVYRKRVRHLTAKNYQLDLFDPDDGYFEYSAIVTNKEVTEQTLWFFMCGRGTHEKVYGEFKGGFAFDCLPTQRYHANSAWQVFSIIAFNLMRAMQAGATERRSTNRKRRTIRPFQTIQTLRYGFINRAGLLIQPGGSQILEVGNNPMVRERFKTIENALAA